MSNPVWSAAIALTSMIEQIDHMSSTQPVTTRGLLDPLPELRMESEGHGGEQHRQHDAHQTKHTGPAHGVKQLAEWTADAEPFGRAEQYGEHEQQEAQTVTTVGWTVFADAGDGAYAEEPNARGIASRIFFHNGSGSRSSSGWTLVSPSWVDPLSLDLRGLVLLEDAVRAISGLILTEYGGAWSVTTP